MKEHILNFMKGFAMGAANVIPGVSGGTVAFLTGIYERLIKALKSFDSTAIKLLLKFRFSQFISHVNFFFLVSVGFGAVVSIVSLAKFLEWAFEAHQQVVWAFFFGLVLASIPFLIRVVKKWNFGVILLLFLGVGVAAPMALLTPASENAHPAYLLLCGVVAMASMIVPGLSGSFILLLMGNYKLIMLESVSTLASRDIANAPSALPVLIPVGIGAVIGLVLLTRFLNWLFANYHDHAVSLITGFVIGSLAVIWPWKEPKEEVIEAAGKTKEKLIGYENWHFPEFTNAAEWPSLGFLFLGVALLVVLEVVGRCRKKELEPDSH